MSNIFHKTFVEDDIHAIPARIYADITARDVDTAFHITANLNKVVRVDSPLAFYVLTATTPTFSEFTNTGSNEWTDLLDTPASISANAAVQGNSGGTALEFIQDLRAVAAPTFGGLKVTTTTDTLLLPRMTTTQRNALIAVAGDIIFNTTANEPQTFDGSVWITTMSLGDVLKVGSPINDQVAIWTGDGTIEGVMALTFDGSRLGVIATTEQFRLGFDAGNFVSFTVDASGNLTIAPTGNETIFAEPVIRPFETGIIASTTQTQGQQPLTEDINTVSVVANGDDVVTMPIARAGRMIVVINSGANQLQIFPASGDNFLGGAANASITIGAGNMRIFAATDATEWGYINAV